MSENGIEHLALNLRSALRIPPGDGGDLAMTAALRGKHPADIADAIQNLDHSEALAVFNWLDNARAAEVLDEIDSELSKYLIQNAPPSRIADLLDVLPMDDAAEVVAEVAEDEPEQAREIMESLEAKSPEDAAEVRQLLSYPDGTAGRLMTDKFLRITSDQTVEETFRMIRSAGPDVETLTDFYVVDERDYYGQKREWLIGLVNMRHLARTKPSMKISEIMITNPITVSVDTDQEEAARTIAKYDFLALPVLDREGYLAGILTVDDIMDVLVEEQTEDVLALGAVSPSEAPYLSNSIFTTFRQRFYWLLLLFVAETATGTVLRHFEGELSKVVALSFFIPLLIGSGGNAGAQTVTTITRALALGDVTIRDWVTVLWHEARTGLLLGAGLAAIGFLRAYFFWNTPVTIAEIVGLSLIVIVVWATLVGSLLPIMAKRLGFDPAVMSAPFITTLVDATGLFFYFTIAKIMLGL